MVAQREIPGKPLLDLRGDPNIEVHPVCARVRKIIEHPKALSERTRARQLEGVFIAPERLRRVPGQWRAETGMVVVGPAEQVQHAAFVLHRVESEAAANYKPQVQI